METTTDVQELGDVWGRIRRWPEPIQLELASRILQSVRQVPAESSQQGSFADLIGLWDKGQPQFSDEQLDQILAEGQPRNTAKCEFCSIPTSFWMRCCDGHPGMWKQALSGRQPGKDALLAPQASYRLPTCSTLAVESLGRPTDQRRSQMLGES